MTQLTDEEIQQLLDADLNPEFSDGVDAYQKIYNELSKTSALPTSDSANDIVRVVYGQSERRSDFKTYSASALCLIIGMLLFYAVMHYVDSLLAERLLQTIINLKWIVLFFVFLVLTSMIMERISFRNK